MEDDVVLGGYFARLRDEAVELWSFGERALVILGYCGEWDGKGIRNGWECGVRRRHEAL